jgi:amino acid transporter
MGRSGLHASGYVGRTVEDSRSQEPEQGLLADQLGTLDLTASTVANIGLGIDFYFGFGVIVFTAGVGAPLTILAAALAIGLLAWTVSEFTRAEPSAGSFITYVESAFGRTSGAVITYLVTIGYTIAMAGVITMCGGFLSLTIGHFTSTSVPWILPTIVIALAGLWLMVRAVKLSTSAVAAAVVIQIVIMVIICALVLVEQRGHLSLEPFRWSAVTGKLAGLSAGFPLALYMFIGWENSPSLAEETRDPVRTIPRALFISIALTTLLFVLFAYSTIVGFHYDVSSVGRSSIPFLTVADHVLGPVAIVAWIAGIVSVLATFVAGTTSQARMVFDGGREGFLPRRFGTTHRAHGTPVVALGFIVMVGIAVILAWGIAHWLGAGAGSMDPVGLYAECSTLGTIIILFVYMATNLSLPFFIWQRHRAMFSAVRHVLIPLLGMAALIVPFVELFHPGQSAPYDLFPFLALAVLLVCMVAASATQRARRKRAREGAVELQK